mmetsp:Transcript_172603/g.548054  ORF Transcript_172603/g.548054 Transcript_172603/m.548054 type:complete len:126 (-) Transcript_172603:94-471(-)
MVLSMRGPLVTSGTAAAPPTRALAAAGAAAAAATWPGYTKLSYGASGCAAGREIASEGECRRAIASLGLDPQPSWSGSDGSVPPLCSMREQDAGDGQHMHWNVLGEGEVGSGRDDLAPVCRAAAT